MWVVELCTYEGPHPPVYGLLAFLLISPFMSVPLQLLMSLLHKKGGGVSLEHLTSSSVSYCWLLGLMCGALGLMTGSLHAHYCLLLPGISTWGS